MLLSKKLNMIPTQKPSEKKFFILQPCFITLCRCGKHLSKCIPNHPLGNLYRSIRKVKTLMELAQVHGNILTNSEKHLQTNCSKC